MYFLYTLEMYSVMKIISIMLDIIICFIRRFTFIWLNLKCYAVNLTIYRIFRSVVIYELYAT